MPEVTAQVHKTINASPSEVWRSLTSAPDLKKFFFDAEVESDWQRGSPIRIKGAYQGKPYEDKGEILKAEPPRVLSFSNWSSLAGKPDMNENYHVITFALEPEGKNTKVTLSQANLVGDATPLDVEKRAEYEKNWSMVLDGLAKLFTQG